MDGKGIARLESTGRRGPEEGRQGVIRTTTGAGGAEGTEGAARPLTARQGAFVEPSSTGTVRSVRRFGDETGDRVAPGEGGRGRGEAATGSGPSEKGPVE
ncbi:hypothetical protein GCM10011583_32110 [Streptomyces camponoticapitis]|uniref:Uncharacterized protein n=1 Tax=Streptomyces camponoticapitis TaxID=1616125 RepID=A0ABQ2EB40_9ACTN|nr:hypothetical protein GCM10011583_32110 [Streptomyces camponoticapitis]